MGRRHVVSANRLRLELGQVRRRIATSRAECRSTLTGLVAAAAMLLAVAAAPARAEGAPFSQAVIDAAMSEPDLRYAPSEACPGPVFSTLEQIGTSYCVLRPAQAFYFLALTVYLDPDARASDHRLVWRRVVELFNVLTSDGNGPQVARRLVRWTGRTGNPADQAHAHSVACARPCRARQSRLADGGDGGARQLGLQ